jgi:hypothetical protein
VVNLRITSFGIQNPTLQPSSAFMCALRQTKNRIKRLVFVKKTNCVYCEVGMLYNHLHKIHTHRVSLTAEARVRSLVGPCEIYGKVTPGQVFNIPVLQFSPVSIPVPMLHTHINLEITLIRRTSGRNLGTCEQSRTVGEVGSSPGSRALSRRTPKACQLLSWG